MTISKGTTLIVSEKNVYKLKQRKSKKELEQRRDKKWLKLEKPKIEGSNWSPRIKK